MDAAELDRHAPKVRSAERLAHFLPLLQCPKTKSGFRPFDPGTGFLEATGGQRWEVRDFVPILCGFPDVKVHSPHHLSNVLTGKAKKLLDTCEGWALNLSAGGSEEWRENVIEVEAAIFRNTDLVGDAHELPFKDGVFDVCVAMNAFEHYSMPHVAASEIARVLKPGGTVLIHTAFLQPIHEPPYHFFNATKYGVAQWFERFHIETISTSENFNPLYGISWILSDLIDGLHQAGRSDDADYLGALRVDEVMGYWRSKTLPPRAIDIFMTLPDELKDRLAAGVELQGTKPR